MVLESYGSRTIFLVWRYLKSAAEKQLSPAKIAAVDWQHYSADIVGCLGCKENSRTFQIIGLSPAPERHSVKLCLILLGIRALRKCYARRNVSGRKRVCPYTGRVSGGASYAARARFNRLSTLYKRIVSRYCRESCAACCTIFFFDI